MLDEQQAYAYAEANAEKIALAVSASRLAMNRLCIRNFTAHVEAEKLHEQLLQQRLRDEKELFAAEQLRIATEQALIESIQTRQLAEQNFGSSKKPLNARH